MILVYKKRAGCFSLMLDIVIHAALLMLSCVCIGLVYFLCVLGGVVWYYSTPIIILFLSCMYCVMSFAWASLLYVFGKHCLYIIEGCMGQCTYLFGFAVRDRFFAVKDIDILRVAPLGKECVLQVIFDGEKYEIGHGIDKENVDKFLEYVKAMESQIIIQG